MTRSKCILGTTFPFILALHTKKKEKLCQDGIHTMLFAYSNCECIPTLSPVAPFYSGQNIIYAYFWIN